MNENEKEKRENMEDAGVNKNEHDELNCCQDYSDEKCDDPAEQVGIDEIGEMRAQLEKTEAEKKELLMLVQRVQADFENFRRRTRIEKDEMLKFAVEDLVSKMLPVLDNFQRALDAIKAADENKGFAEGVEMIFRQFKQVLTDEGLTDIEAVGGKFDPSCHEAVMQVEEEGFEKDTVVEELQRGYKLKDRLIRPSMVKVAK